MAPNRAAGRARAVLIAAWGATAFTWVGPYAIEAQQPAPAGSCRVSGRAVSAGIPLPGVSIVVNAGTTPRAATSTDVDGTYRLTLPSGTYQVTAELTGFDRIARDVTVSVSAPCDQTIDLQLALTKRAAATSPSQAPTATARGRGGQPGTAAGAAPAQRFETLAVQTQAAAAAPAESNDTGDLAARLLLPPGFSTDGPTEALAINGNMASIDRGMMAERLEAIGRGEFDPTTGAFGDGFGPGGRGFGGRGGPGGPEGFGGPGGFAGRVGPGGREGGPGAFVIGGRGRGQNAYNVQSNYGFSGSPLDSAPYELRPGSAAQQRPYSRQTIGVTAGGPVRIPGVYKGDRRTTFVANYAATRGGDLFDQYATVPTAAMRNGDFSTLPAPLIDPHTGTAFADNRIPSASLDPAARSLLRFIPLPNLDGTTRNFHYATTNVTASDNLNLRVTHNFTPNAGGRGAPGGRGGGGRGGFGGPGGRGRGAQTGTSVNLTAQFQYRRNDTEQNNVFPTLGGQTTGSSVALPLSLNIQHKRTSHAVNVNYSRTASQSINQYAGIEDVAGEAGITGVSTDSFDWGVPQLSFSSLSSVRDVIPSKRIDRRLTIGYGWTRPLKTTHLLRIGGDVRFDRSESETSGNARGAFVFTGLYSSGGSVGTRGGGLDFADFLLGLPQQATVQYGPGNVRMSGTSLSAYVQDDWRKSATLTINLGLRYELIQPFYELSGHMVNLDVAPDFTAAVPVVSGGSGPFSGAYPKALLAPDRNNVAPRIGVAWRMKPGTVLRGGYGVSYNAGSYSTIARQLTAQPPFAVTDTSLGTVLSPLSLSDPFPAASQAGTTNNFGVDRNYALGVVQTVNGDLSRDLRQVWNVGGGYTYTRGSSLDMLRAPNRGPTGLRIPGVEPFLWQTSQGASVLHAATFRVSRRPSRGIGGGATYTLARSRDDASTLGGGGSTVAQDDRNLAAEWGPSSFDRRHQFSANLSVELPFGPNRRWLTQPGVRQSIFRDWRFALTFTGQSGTPYTPRVTGSVADVARGTNGTLRADYNGQPIAVADPTIDRFFNTTAFSVPAVGLFGTASRNMIVGPGSRLLNAQFTRDVRLGGTRVMSLQINANNLLNMVNYAALDTVVNSPTFGEILSVRPMRSTQLNVRFRF